MPVKKKPALKHFKCPRCNATETQEPAVIAVQHTHEGKVYTLEQINAPQETPAEKPKLGKSKTSRYVDGRTGVAILGS